MVSLLIQPLYDLFTLEPNGEKGDDALVLCPVVTHHVWDLQGTSQGKRLFQAVNRLCYVNTCSRV
jgi:hypothetical protein